jgi:hypothetical protein
MSSPRASRLLGDPGRHGDVTDDPQREHVSLEAEIAALREELRKLDEAVLSLSENTRARCSGDVPVHEDRRFSVEGVSAVYVVPRSLATIANTASLDIATVGASLAAILVTASGTADDGRTSSTMACARPRCSMTYENRRK